MRRLAVWGLVAPLLLWLAWRIRSLWFLCDDAFISFRYARNMLEGHGLVYNVGEAVEGYTNFLWVLQVAALWAVGIRPEVSANAMSLACTVAVLAVLAWWARAEDPVQGSLRAAIAVALLCVNRTFAVWATSGLETRQFTLCVLLGLALLDRRGDDRATAAALAFAAAALTRPEGILYFAVAAAVVALQHGWQGRRQILSFVAPAGSLIGAHMVFRLASYGDIVPNTYHAKHVRPWVDMGVQYVQVAAVEHAWFLVVPLAVLGFGVHGWRRGDGRALIGPLAVAAHAVFLIRVGGDHFEFRPLDTWLPILALGAAQGLTWACRGVWAAAVPAAAVTAAYAATLGVAHDATVHASLAANQRPNRMVRIRAEKHTWLAALPPLRTLLPSYERRHRDLLHRNIAVRHWRHREFGAAQRARFEPLEAGRAQLALPNDAVDAVGSIGALGFYLPDLTVIDTLGLTDSVVARTPTARDNTQRRMAHDRHPPPGYLTECGVNIDVHPPQHTVAEALAERSMALVAGDELFLPIHSTAPDWIRETFADRLIERRLGHSHATSALVLPEETARGVAVVPRAGWTTTGDVFTGGWPVSWTPGAAAGRGTQRSPPFPVGDARSLGMMLGGGGRSTVRLLVGGRTVLSAPATGGRSARFLLWDLRPWAGETLQVELVDDDPRQQIHVDHLILFD